MANTIIKLRDDNFYIGHKNCYYTIFFKSKNMLYLI